MKLWPLRPLFCGDLVMTCDGIVVAVGGEEARACSLHSSLVYVT